MEEMKCPACGSTHCSFLTIMKNPDEQVICNDCYHKGKMEDFFAEENNSERAGDNP